MNTDRDETIKIFNNTIEIFRQIKCEISKVKSEYQISKRQGIGLENAFAIKILEVIYKVVYDGSRGLVKPFLYLSSDPNDSFEKFKLILFIDIETEIIETMKMENNLLISEYYENFEKRIYFFLTSCTPLQAISNGNAEE